MNEYLILIIYLENDYMSPLYAFTQPTEIWDTFSY